VIAATDFLVELAEATTTARVRIPIDDDAIDEPTEYFTGRSMPATQCRSDSPGREPRDGPRQRRQGNRRQDRADGRQASQHRSSSAVATARRGCRTQSPKASDAVDGVVPDQCNPASMAAMPVGLTKVTCTATDSAGNSASNNFQVTVRSLKANGPAKVVGGYRQCVSAGQALWVEAEGYTANSSVTIQLQSSSLEVTRLKTCEPTRRAVFDCS
jgi:hypothetical protein